MQKGFDIIDGMVYVDKWLFQEAQQLDNNISKLTGSYSVNLFRPRPMVTTGIDSVTIDYHNIDRLGIEKDPQEFLEELRSTYKYKIRGHIVIQQESMDQQDIVINRF
jgi:hypothetical protein